ncbi:hypothetical protein NMY22_g6715 [Coprinellus aureogranulatus]|nr:hypothetical protein NMY22_g6715 [Coprinellus aureogranulatus]
MLSLPSPHDKSLRRAKLEKRLPPLVKPPQYRSHQNRLSIFRFVVPSAESSDNREYRPLADPPPPNSPYHKHGGLIARLELLDALLCFTYAIWNKDYGRHACNKDTWSTIQAFLSWCQAKWAGQQEGISDAEKAFIGLISMIEAFIHGRKLMYTIKDHLERDLTHVTSSMKDNIQDAADKAEASIGLKTGSGGTPTMLPSPASIAPTNSANSTPTYKEDSTPNRSSSTRPPPNTQPPRPPLQVRTGPSPIPIPLLPTQYTNNNRPIPSEVGKAMKEVRESIGPALANDVQEFVAGYKASGRSMGKSQPYLNLPVMMRCFPSTFNRMMHSTLLPNEEHEPDFDDDEGELFWPGQLVTGEGLGWVCLMGKSMVKEFGKAYGYRGLAGVVPKPQAEEPADGPPPSHRPPPNSMPSNRNNFAPSNSYHHSNSSHGNR